MNLQDAPAGGSPAPAKLYRFRPPRKREIDAIFGRGQLWFSKPSKLGDPFECAPELVPPPAEELERHLLETEVGPLSPGDKRAWSNLRRKVKRRLGSDSFLAKAFREVVDGSGHVVYLERREAFFSILKAFLAAKSTGFAMPSAPAPPRAHAPTSSSGALP